MKFKQRIKLCWRILCAKPGNLMAYAEHELPLIGSDEMGLTMANNLRELLLVFCTQRHSAFSASYLRRALANLLAYEPLSPLTGADDEWVDHGYCKHNKRCIGVFIQADRFAGRAYNSDAIMFREPGGAIFMGKGSAQPITFPYTPVDPIVLDVDDDGNPTNGWDREGVYADWLDGRVQTNTDGVK